MHKVFLSLGANVGHRKANLRKAVKMLSSGNDTLQQASSIYETEPWGTENQPNFYNQVVVLRTTLDPFELLDKIHIIEAKCGRKPSLVRYTPRPMDIDILIYDSQILTSKNLKIPHPLIHLRRFVLEPLAEIAPDLLHPVLGKSMRFLLQVCDDPLKVAKVS